MSRSEQWRPETLGAGKIVMEKRLKEIRTKRDSLDDDFEILGSTQGSSATGILKSTAFSWPAKRAAAASFEIRHSDGWVTASRQHKFSTKSSHCWFVMALFASYLFSGTNFRKRNFLNLVTTQYFPYQILQLYIICECIKLFLTFRNPFNCDIISTYKAEIIG